MYSYKLGYSVFQLGANSTPTPPVEPIPITTYDLTSETYTSAQVDDWLRRQNAAGLSNKLLILDGNTYTSASGNDRNEMGLRFVTIQL